MNDSSHREGEGGVEDVDAVVRYEVHNAGKMESKDRREGTTGGGFGDIEVDGAVIMTDVFLVQGDRYDVRQVRVKARVVYGFVQDESLRSNEVFELVGGAPGADV